MKTSHVAKLHVLSMLCACWVLVQDLSQILFSLPLFRYMLNVFKDLGDGQQVNDVTVVNWMLKESGKSTQNYKVQVQKEWIIIFQSGSAS